MIRRAIILGVVAGILLGLSGLYPAVTLLAPTSLPGWDPVANELGHGLLLMASALIFVPTFLGVGWVAARHPHVRGLREGVLIALVAAGFMCAICFVTLLSPLNALFAYGRIVPFFPPMPEALLPPDRAIIAAVGTLGNTPVAVEALLILGMAVAGVLGGIAGRRQQQTAPPPRESLFALVQSGREPAQWFAENESALRVGLIVGVLISLLLIPTAFSQFYLDLAQDWPQLGAIMRRAMTGSAEQIPLSQRSPLLSPLVNLSLITFGALVIVFLRNPASRFAARIQGVVLAGVIIFVSWFAAIARTVYLYVGLLPFQWYSPATAGIPGVVAGAGLPSLDLITSRTYFVAAVFIFSWLFLVIAVLVGLFAGLLQGTGYSMLMTFLRPRPVDRAAGLQRRLRSQPAEVVPLIYAQFSRYDDALPILAHLADRTYRSRPEISRLAAAYHTLATGKDPAGHLQTSIAIHNILVAHPEWRWSGDIGRVYATFHRILSARTLEQILGVGEPPQMESASLPPLMVQSVQHISRIVNELHKIEMVDDLATKLIFLENVLEAIHEAQHFVNTALRDRHTGQVLAPEQAALANVLDHWQGVVLRAIKKLKGRADVFCVLQTHTFTHTGRVPLLFEITNQGLNVAQQVCVSLRPGHDYDLEGEGTCLIEILPPAETRQITLPVSPHQHSRRMRVAWDVRYDDAVDADRMLEFADVVEFVVPERPFQRVFPIPYVTGTPLKTNDVFVGREDVFAFIRENLLGAHQNNVIILHGQRRTGKTSVLYRLGQVMAGTHIGVLIDMQGKPARGEADFLYSVADDIVFALEDQEIFVDLPAREAFVAAPEFQFRSRFLRSLYPHLNGKQLLLMFDEFEELQRRVEDGHLQPTIFPFLRNLMQHENPIDFVFSGTHKLEALGAEYWSVLFNIAAYKPITFLSRKEVQRLLEEPVADYNVEFDPLVLERLMQVTAGHPYFTQLILHEMMVFHNEVERSYLTTADLEQVLERIVERGEAHFKYIWAESSVEERRVLEALTQLITSPDPINTGRLRNVLAENGYDSPDGWERALNGLEERDILQRQDAHSSLYRFKVDLVRLWVARTRPVV